MLKHRLLRFVQKLVNSNKQIKLFNKLKFSKIMKIRVKIKRKNLFNNYRNKLKQKQ